jgi:hypothetical protein
MKKIELSTKEISASHASAAGRAASDIVQS